MITTIVTIIAIIEFFLLFFVVRYLWYVLSYGIYISFVKEFIEDHKDIEPKLTDEQISQLYEIWPLSSVMIRFWDFRLRNFIVSLEGYDVIVAYINDKYYNKVNSN